MVAKLQFPVNLRSDTPTFGAIFQGRRGLKDIVTSDSYYVGQEEAFNPKIILSIAKKMWRSVLCHIGKERLWKAAL